MVIKWQPSDPSVVTKWSSTHQLVTKQPPRYPNTANILSPNDPKLIPNWSISNCSQSGHKTNTKQQSGLKAVNKWLKRQRWSTSGHQRVTKRPQLYLTVATKQPPIDPKVVTKRSPSCHKFGNWPSAHQLVTKRPPSYPKEVNKWLPIDPKLIQKWSKCGHQTAINVVWKQQAIPKWF